MPLAESYIRENYTMNPFLIVLIILLVIAVAALVGLYFFGRNLETKQIQQKEAMEAAKQTISMLVIDKKRLKIKESGLPQMVYEQTPWYLKRSKLPIVKAKVANRIMTLVADEKAFAMIPIKTEVKAVVSGIYITEVKSARGGLLTPPTKKAKFWEKWFKKEKSS